jgi:hypothetical protein
VAAWYASVVVVNNMAGRAILPAGAPLWSEPAAPVPSAEPGARLRPVGRRRGLPADINGAVRRDRGQTPVRPRAGPHTEGRQR